MNDNCKYSRFFLETGGSVIVFLGLFYLSQSIIIPILFTILYKKLLFKISLWYVYAVVILMFYISFTTRICHQGDLIYDTRTRTLSHGKIFMLWSPNFVSVYDHIPESFKFKRTFPPETEHTQLIPELEYEMTVSVSNPKTANLPIIRMQKPKKLGILYFPYSSKEALEEEIAKLIQECIKDNARSIYEGLAPIDVLFKNETYERYVQTMLKHAGIDAEIEMTNARLKFPLN